MPNVTFLQRFLRGLRVPIVESECITNIIPSFCQQRKMLLSGGKLRRLAGISNNIRFFHSHNRGVASHISTWIRLKIHFHEIRNGSSALDKPTLKSMLLVPNIITMSRIIISPVISFFMLKHRFGEALCLISFSVLTDFVLCLSI